MHAVILKIASKTNKKLWVTFHQDTSKLEFMGHLFALLTKTITDFKKKTLEMFIVKLLDYGTTR